MSEVLPLNTGAEGFILTRTVGHIDKPQGFVYVAFTLKSLVDLCLEKSWSREFEPRLMFDAGKAESNEPFVHNRVEIFGRSFDFTIPEKKVDVGKATRLMVENLHGSVRITGADTQQVTAGGRKSIRALQDKDADEADRQTPVDVAVNGDMMVVRTNQDRLTGQQRVTTDLEVTVPRGLSVEVRGRNNDSIEVTAVNGGVEIAADEASVRLDNIGGNVRLSDVHKSELLRAANVKGTVDIQGGKGRDIELDTIGGEVTIDGSYSGDLEIKNLAKPLRIVGPNAELRVERTPGEIHMDLGKFEATNLVGPVRLTSNRARDVEIEKFTQSLDVSLDHGDISLRPLETPLSKINAHTHNGQVELTLPEKAAFDLKAATSHGEPPPLCQRSRACDALPASSVVIQSARSLRPAGPCCTRSQSIV